MKRSVIAAIAVLVLALLSMGALGAGLYYAAYPALFPAFGDLPLHFISMDRLR
jgi:hypothetical protein